MSLTPAEELKQKGNSFYNLHDFAKANESYTKALEKLEHGDKNSKKDNNDLTLRAALHSNRGNSRFELGDYEGAAQDSRDVLGIIANDLYEGESSGQKRNKMEMNKWRLVRCLFYLKADKSALNEIISTITDPSLKRKCKKILHSTDYVEKISANTNSPEDTYNPQFVRTNLAFPYCEYYPFGHDIAESALCDVDINKNSTFNVLYGGVSDGRHVYATMLEAHYRNEKKNTCMKLHVTMNDINASVLLKDILVLVLVHRIGSLLKNNAKGKKKENILKDLKNCREAYLIMSVLYYGTLTYAMPPRIYETLQNLLREIFINETCGSFNAKYSWLYIPNNLWTKIHHIAKCWANISMFHPQLVSVESCLTLYSRPDNSNCGKERIESYGAIMGLGDRTEELLRSKAVSDARKKVEISNMVDRMVAGDPSIPQPEWLFDLFPKDISAEEVEATKEELVSMMMEEIKSEGTGQLKLDVDFIEGTSTLLPPTAADGIPEMEEFREMRESIQNSHEKKDRGSTMRAIHNARDTIHRKWHVNPMKFCPDWNSFNEGPDQDTTNPVKEFPLFFCHDKIHEMLLHKVSGSFQQMAFQDSLFDLFSLFYSNVGCAMMKLVQDGNLSVEISFGSIVDFSNEISSKSKESREKLNLPVSFEEVFLSNVPDYTGLLSCLVQIGPILNRNANEPSRLRSNILLNCALFDHYDQYTYSSTALSANGISRILKMKCLEEKPDVWNAFNRWGIREDVLENPVTYVEFKAWVHRLFLGTSLPPFRDGRSILREEHPNTMDLFLWVCKYCIEHLNYPIHWVTNSLESLLAKGHLKTKATMNNSSPTSFQGIDGKKLKVYDLSAVQLELRNQLSIFVSHGLLPSQLLVIDCLPKGKPIRCTLNIEISHSQNPGNPNVSCIGFLLEKEKNHDYEIKSNDDMFGMMVFGLLGRLGRPKPQVELRESLLRKGDSAGHLFSTARYNFQSFELSFHLCKDVFDEYGDHYVSLVRTDCWGALNHDMVRLKEAEVSFME